METLQFVKVTNREGNEIVINLQRLTYAERLPERGVGVLRLQFDFKNNVELSGKEAARVWELLTGGTAEKPREWKVY